MSGNVAPIRGGIVDRASATSGLPGTGAWYQPVISKVQNKKANFRHMRTPKGANLPEFLRSARKTSSLPQRPASGADLSADWQRHCVVPPILEVVMQNKVSLIRGWRVVLKDPHPGRLKLKVRARKKLEARSDFVDMRVRVSLITLR